MVASRLMSSGVVVQGAVSEDTCSAATAATAATSAAQDAAGTISISPATT